MLDMGRIGRRLRFIRRFGNREYDKEKTGDQIRKRQHGRLQTPLGNEAN